MSEIRKIRKWEKTDICWSVWGESLRTGSEERILEVRRGIVGDLWDVARRERGHWGWTRGVVVAVSAIRTWWNWRKTSSHD